MNARICIYQRVTLSLTHRLAGVRMTMRNYDYTFYQNAREWFKLHKIDIDPEDRPMLSEEDIMNITGRGDPVVIRGTRRAPIAKSQMIPKVAPPKVKPKKKTAKSAAADEVESSIVSGGADSAMDSMADAATTSSSDQRLFFVIAPKSNPFSKKDDIERITWRVPLDGTTEIILASAIVAPQLSGFTSFMRNIDHATLEYNTLRRFPPDSHKVIRDPDEIKSHVGWDVISSDLGLLPKMHATTDKFAFWLDAHPGDVVTSQMNAEDTCVQFDYRLVIR